MSNKEHITSLLYSYADWQTIGRKDLPYHIEIEKGDQVLFYFGAKHSHNPESPQYSVLREYWHSFLEKTRGGSRIVLTEGGVRKVHANEVEAIHRDLEAGLMALFADQANIPIESPEPTRYDQTLELSRQFSKEEIEYYYFARMLNQWLNLPDNLKEDPRHSYAGYLGSALYYDKKESGWADFNFSLENMEIIHEKLFNWAFDRNDGDFFSSITDPRKDISVINKVARACSQFRNVYMVGRIEELWHEGKSIFVVFGGSHLIMQERALRELLI